MIIYARIYIMLNKITSLKFFENSDKLTEWILLSIVLIPFFKIIISTLNINIPVYYGPTVALAAYVALKNKYLNLKLFSINAIILIFILIGAIHDQKVSLSSLKIYLAAIVFVNLIYVLYVSFNSSLPQDFESFITKHYNISLKLSILFMGFCLLAFVFNCYKYPFEFSLEHLKQYLTFDRVNANLRAQLLIRFNPVAFIKADINNIRYIGQQLLILPITTFGYALILKHKVRMNALFIALLTISVFLTNSRAMFLTLFAILVLAYIPRVPKWLHIFYCSLCMLFPFSLSLFSSDFISNRLCQIQFVKSHLTTFGNGLGAYIEELNQTCGTVKQGSGYQNIVTTSYDNIHIELIHYFGLFGYALLLALTLFWAFYRNNYICRLFIFFIFIFLSLNFNLFEVLFLPVLIITYFATDKIKPNLT